MNNKPNKPINNFKTIINWKRLGGLNRVVTWFNGLGSGGFKLLGAFLAGGLFSYYSTIYTNDSQIQIKMMDYVAAKSGQNGEIINISKDMADIGKHLSPSWFSRLRWIIYEESIERRISEIKKDTIGNKLDKCKELAEQIPKTKGSLDNLLFQSLDDEHKLIYWQQNLEEVLLTRDNDLTDTRTLNLFIEQYDLQIPIRNQISGSLTRGFPSTTSNPPANMPTPTPTPTPSPTPTITPAPNSQNIPKKLVLDYLNVIASGGVKNEDVVIVFHILYEEEGSQREIFWWSGTKADFDARLNDKPERILPISAKDPKLRASVTTNAYSISFDEHGTRRWSGDEDRVSISIEAKYMDSPFSLELIPTKVPSYGGGGSGKQSFAGTITQSLLGQ